jgi:hypothetical protein
LVSKSSAIISGFIWAVAVRGINHLSIERFADDVIALHKNDDPDKGSLKSQERKIKSEVTKWHRMWLKENK